MTRMKGGGGGEGSLLHSRLVWPSLLKSEEKLRLKAVTAQPWVILYLAFCVCDVKKKVSMCGGRIHHEPTFFSSLVKSKPTRLHPKEFKFKGKKYPCLYLFRSACVITWRHLKSAVKPITSVTASVRMNMALIQSMNARIQNKKQKNSIICYQLWWMGDSVIFSILSSTIKKLIRIQYQINASRLCTVPILEE